MGNPAWIGVRKNREKGIPGRGNNKCKGPEADYLSDSEEAHGTRVMSKERREW